MLELEKLKNADKVVGTRRLLRAISAGVHRPPGARGL